MPGPGVVVPPVPEIDLDLRAFVRPGDTVVWGQAAGEPLALTRALLAQREAVGPVRGFTVLTYDDAVGPEHQEHLRMVGLGGLGGLARLARAGALEVLPCSISALPRLFADGRLRCDVVLVQVSPADGEGWHRLGVGVGHLPHCLDVAPVILAEVNERLPVTAGPYRLHADRITASVRTSRPLIEVAGAAPGPVDLAVAERVVDLVPDGATVQFGIGRLPDAITAALGRRRGLGVHTGLLTDAFVDLVEAGAVDSGRPAVTAEVVGTDRAYRLAGDGRTVELHPYATTHGPDVLARLPRLAAVNSALEVDLSGQVAAEVVGGVQVGAVGGQVDFLRGAARSDGGLPIIALPSTAGGGRVSRIVARLTSGVVTTARSDAGLVVTEHGVADLRGRTLRERAEALIAVADPAFRDDLRRSARAAPA